MEWLRDLKEGDRVQYLARGWTMHPEICTIDKASFRFVYVQGFKFSRQTGYLTGSDRKPNDARLKKFNE